MTQLTKQASSTSSFTVSHSYSGKRSIGVIIPSPVKWPAFFRLSLFGSSAWYYSVCCQSLEGDKVAQAC